MGEEKKNILNEGGKALISVISAYLKGEPIPKINDYKILYLSAKRHSLGNFLYFALQNEKDVPTVVQETLLQHFYSQTAQQMMQEYYSSKVFEEFENRKIKYMPMKGYYLRKLYPQPEMRTSCDVDIFYDESRKDEVDEIFKGLGFNWTGRSYTDDHYEKEAITLEMHYVLAGDREMYGEYYKNVWDRLKTENGVKYEFTPEDYYIHFIVHAAKHFNHGGFGIRTVLDGYLYLKNTKLNREYLNVEFKKLGVERFVEIFEKLTRVWFENQASDERTDALGNYIIDSATYGTVESSRLLKSIFTKKSARKSKTKFILSAMFLPYGAMKLKYPILKPLPFLLPFAWVYRWITAIFTKKDKIKQIKSSADSYNNDNMKKTEEMLDIAGTPRD